MKARISINNGKIVNGREDLARLFEHADNGEYIIVRHSLADPHTPEEWRKTYFFLRDLLWEEADTGYTKKELHMIIKEKCLLPLSEENFIDGKLPTLSTAYLTPVGWRNFVKAFKEFAMDAFEIYI